MNVVPNFKQVGGEESDRGTKENTQRSTPINRE
jgi:hypothetical protein